MKAWSNGRMKAGRHRVTMSGDKDRYSFGDVVLAPSTHSRFEPPGASTHNPRGGGLCTFAR
ncbi:gibberellin 20 oxidase 1-like protein, partial [Corchorus olitorius]